MWIPAGGEYVSMGGRDAEMTFGIGKVKYQEMYIHGAADDDDGEADWRPDLTALRLDAQTGSGLEQVVDLQQLQL